jgi:hypothetical protein
VPVVMEIVHLLGVLLVPASSLATRVATAMMAGPSLSSSGGVEPPSKRSHPWSFLPVSSQYVHGVVHMFTPLLLLLFWF